MVQRRGVVKTLRVGDGDIWSYRGEGKTGLVVTNNNGLVLKLRKGLFEEDYLALYKRNCQYVQICIAPAFGPFLCYGQVCRLPPEFSTRVMNNIQNRRFSLKDSAIDTRCPYALLMPDACSLSGHPNTITIEIKPKSYLRTLNDSQPPLKCCRFCSNIETRFARGVVGARTQYCPRDLFSGRPARVARAIGALLDEPLSYLTIHKAGKRVFDEDCSMLDEVLGPGYFRTRAELITVVVNTLLSKQGGRGNVLQVIEEAQRVNRLSIPELCKIQETFRDRNLDIDRELALWLSGESTLDAELSTLLKLVINFSVSIIAQDISIMIAISPGPGDQHPQVVLDGRVYSYRVSIVDVDLKSVKKLPRYLKQERELATVLETTELANTVAS